MSYSVFTTFKKIPLFARVGIGICMILLVVTGVLWYNLVSQTTNSQKQDISVSQPFSTSSSQSSLSNSLTVQSSFSLSSTSQQNISSVAPSQSMQSSISESQSENTSQIQNIYGGSDEFFDIDTPIITTSFLRNGYTVTQSKSSVLPVNESWISRLGINSSLYSYGQYTTMSDSSGTVYNIGPSVDYINQFANSWILAVRIGYSSYTLFECDLECRNYTILVPYTNRIVVSVAYSDLEPDIITLFSIPDFDRFATPVEEKISLPTLIQNARPL